MPKKKHPYTRVDIGDAGEIDVFPCYIKGDLWTYSLVTDRQMVILAEDKDTAAYCSEKERRIYVSRGALDHTNIIHELSHAFRYETSVTSSDLKAGQTEEQMCEIFSKHWPKILRLAGIIFYNLCLYRDLKGEASRQWIEAGPLLVDHHFGQHMADLIDAYDAGLGENPFHLDPSPLMRSSIQINKAARARKKSRR